MKILKMHLTEVAVAFLFIVIVCVFTHRDEGESLESMSWNRNWTLAAGEESRSYEMLPESVNLSEGEEEIIIRKELPQDISSADSIGFYRFVGEVFRHDDGSAYQKLLWFLSGKNSCVLLWRLVWHCA